MQRIISIPELREKYYCCIKINPKLRILDFTSKGILQPYLLWNLTIITMEKSHWQQSPVRDEALIFSCCFLLLVNLVVEGHCREHRPNETHSNYYNSASNVVTWGRLFYPHNQPSATQENHKHGRAQAN